MKGFDTAIILAGGQSKRMGFDKQFLRIDDRWIIDLQINRLKGLFKEIIIVTNKSEEYDHYSYKIVEDEIRNFGPLGGIHAGLKHANNHYNYVIACDMPYINIDYIKYMAEQIEAYNGKIEAVVTRFGDWIEPMNAFYSKSLIEKIEKKALEGNRKISILLEEANVFYIEESKARKFSSQWEMFINLNNPNDAEKYLKHRNGEI